MTFPFSFHPSPPSEVSLPQPLRYTITDKPVTRSRFNGAKERTRAKKMAAKAKTREDRQKVTAALILAIRAECHPHSANLGTSRAENQLFPDLFPCRLSFSSSCLSPVDPNALAQTSPKYCNVGQDSLQHDHTLHSCGLGRSGRHVPQPANLASHLMR